MSSIDERVVQMQFENSQFEKGIKETVKSLGLLKKELDMKDASESIEHLQSVGDSFSLAQISSQLEKLVDRTSWFTKMIHREIDSIWAKTKSLGKSLSVDQVSAGWTKYEQKTASVQTIMNATGKSIDEVNGYLDKLMWFSDETSYNFTEMTAALGTLTSSGGDIDKMIPMIEGMATATAFAGKSASEFSRVIYNLNQSYSQGYLSLMDWRSVELAQVGSEQLKQTLIDTAVELGTLKKLSDGTFKTKKGTVVNAGNMGSTLNEKWATKEVMEGAFGKFSQVIEEAYKLVEAGEFDTAADAIASLADKYDETYYKAAKAAQEAKSFKEAIDATKDAVSSGWMKTFELIFGNYEEATALWTDLANALWEVFAAGASERNEMLEAWKEAGGRTDLIQGVTDILSGLWNIISAIKDGFESIFPPVTVNTLLSISSKVKELGERFKELAGSMEVVSGIYRKMVYHEDSLEKYVGELKKGDRGDEVKKLQKWLVDKGYDVGKTGIDGIFGKNTEAALKKFQEDIGQTVDGIYSESNHKSLVGTEITGTIEEVVEKATKYTPALESLQSVIRGIASAFRILLDIGKFSLGIIGKIGDAVILPILDALLSVAGAAGEGITAFADWLDISGTLDRWLDNFGKWLEPIKEWATGIGDSIRDFFGIGDEAVESGKKLSKFGEKWAAFKTTIQPVLDWISARWTSVKDFFSLADIDDGQGNKITRFTAAWNSLKSAIQPVIDWFSNAWKRIKEFFGFGEYVEVDGKKVSRFSYKMQKLYKWFQQKVAPAISPIMQKIKGAWRSLLGFFGLGDKAETSEKGISKFASIFATLKTKAGPVIDWIKNVASKVWSGLMDFFPSIPSRFEKLKETFGGIWEKLKSTFQSDKVKEIFTPVKQAVSTIWEGLKGAFSGITSGNIQTAFDSFKNLVTTVWDGLMNIIDTISSKGFTLGKVLMLFAGVKSIFSFGSILKNIATFITNIGSVVASFSNLGGGVTGILEKVRDVIGGFTGIGDAVGDGLRNWDKKLIGIKTAEKKAQPIGKTILQFALALGLVAAAIYVLGNMDEDKLKRGAKIAGIIMGALLAVSVVGALLEKIPNKGRSVGKDALKLASALLIVAGAIYLFGTMNEDVLRRGLKAVELIGMGFAVFMIFMRFLGTTETNYKGIFAMAGALLVTYYAVKKLGNLDTDVLAKGLIATGLIVLIFSLFMKAMKKSGSFTTNYKGLLSFALVIGILGLVVKSLGGMKTSSLIKGLLGLTVIVLLLNGLMKIVAGMSKNGQSTMKLGGLIGLSVLILFLTRATKQLGQLSVWELIKGLAGIATIMIMIKLLVDSASKISDNGSAKVVVKLGGVAAVIGLMARIVWALGKIPLKELAKGLGALAVIMGLLALVMKVGSKMSSNANFTSFAGMLIIFSGFIYVFGIVLQQIKDIDPLVMVSFAGALSLALVALASACSIAGKTGMKNMLKGAASIGLAITALAAIIGALTWGIGKLQGSKDVASTIKQAVPVLKAIGEAVDAVMESSFGAVIGGVVAAATVLSIMPQSVTASSCLNVLANTALIGLAISTVIALASGIFTAMGAINYDQQWAETIERGVPVIEAISKAISSMCDSAFGWAVLALTGIGQILGQLLGPAAVKGALMGAAVSGILSLSIGAVIAVGAAIFTAFGAIQQASDEQWAQTIEDGIPVFEAIGKAIGAFIGAIKSQTVITMANEMNSLGDVGLDERKVNRVIKLAKSFREFYDQFEAVTAGWVIKELVIGFLGVDSDFTNFCESIGTFAKTMGAYSAHAADVPDNLPKKTKTLTDSAKKIKELYDTFEEKDFFTATWEKLGELVAGGSGFDNFCKKDIPNFVTAVNEYSDKLEGFDDGIEKNTKTAIKIAGSIAKFITSLQAGGDNYIEMKKGGLVGRVTGEDKTNGDTFLEQMSQFATQVVELGETLGGISESKIESDVTTLTNVGNIIATFFSKLGTPDEWPDEINDAVDAPYFAASNAVQGFISQLDEFREAMTGFAKAIDTVNPLKMLTVSLGLKALADQILRLKEESPSADINPITQLLSSFAGETDSGNMAGTIADICNSIITLFKGYANQFEGVGFNFGLGLRDGLRNSKAFAVLAAYSLANSVLTTVKNVLKINSPSKRAIEFGEYFGIGLSDGLVSKEGLVEEAGSKIAIGLQNAVSSMLDGDINTDPVIRPVLDLSDVTSGSKKIDSMLGGGTVSVRASSIKADEASHAYAGMRKLQNESKRSGTESTLESRSEDNSINFSGNSFYVRSEQDVRSLASEIATLTKQQQRSLGATH